MRRPFRLLLLESLAVIVVVSVWIFIPRGEMKRCSECGQGDNAGSSSCVVAR